MFAFFQYHSMVGVEHTVCYESFPDDCDSHITSVKTKRTGGRAYVGGSYRDVHECVGDDSAASDEIVRLVVVAPLSYHTIPYKTPKRVFEGLRR